MILNCKCGATAETCAAYSTSEGHGYSAICHGNDKHVGPVVKTRKGAVVVWNRWMRKDLSIEQIDGQICRGIKP